MTPDRKQMQRALQELVVPRIRAMGFSGSLPHFRRNRGDAFQMLMVMFNKYGGSFYLEAGRLSKTRYVELQRHWEVAGKALDESDLTVGHCGWKERARIGSGHPGPNVDHWFKFGPENLEPDKYREQPLSHYQAVANEVLNSLNSELEVILETAP